MLPLVEELVVDLVGQKPYALVVAKVRKGLHVLLGGDGAGRVLGRVEDDELGLVRHFAYYVLRRHSEAVLQLQPDWHGLAPQVPYHRFVYREARVLIYDLLPLVAGGQKRVEKYRLGAGCDDHLVGRRLKSAGPLDVFADRLANLGYAGRRDVVRVAGVQGLLGRLDDVGRRGEIRLAYFEMQYPPSLLLEGPGACQRLERSLGPDPTHSCRAGLPHAVLPPRRTDLINIFTGGGYMRLGPNKPS